MEHKQLQRMVREYADEFEYRVSSGMGLFLFGDPGLGKSHALALLALRGIEEGKRVRWVQASTLSDFVSQRWTSAKMGDFARYEEIGEKWKRMLTSDLLIIDDFNRNNIPQNSASDKAFAHTLKFRCDAERSTFITTNHSQASFKNAFRPEWFDWMREMNQFVNVEGDSIREKMYLKKRKG
jgi:DNA replication protein DnaC